MTIAETIYCDEYEPTDTSRITLDFGETEKFVQALLQTEAVLDIPLTFQPYAEEKGGKKYNHFSGTLRAKWRYLATLNKERAAIGIMINAGDLKGRSEPNVIEVRALFVDVDEPELVDAIRQWELKPAAIVESSPGLYHVYWPVNEFPLSKFTEFQKRLIAKFGSDPQVNDLPRVMRLPGFLHQKKEPFLVKMIESNPVNYRLEDFERLLPETSEEQGRSDSSTANKLTTRNGSQGNNGRTLSLSELPNLLSYIPAEDYDDWIKVGMCIHTMYPGPEGLAAFNEWSKESEKFSEGEPEQKWQGFGKRNGRKLGAGSLIKMAKERGYVPSSSKRVRSFEEHIDFILSLPQVKAIRRCLFTEELLIETKSGEFTPALNFLDYIGSYAAEDKGYVRQHFPLHLMRYMYDHLKPELLVDIPEWDGQDRLKEICQIIRVKHFDSHEVYELLRHYLVRIFRRMRNPRLQNPTLILQGKQGVGKDTLVNALAGGLDDFLKEINLSGRDPETQLHTALVLRISEFDRTAKTHVATLKHLLTTSKTSCRLAYDRRPQDRYVRASFIATCNIADILRDHTGNRRFWILEIEYAGFATLPSGAFATEPEKDYPGMFARQNWREEQKQILAQARHLAELGDHYPSQQTVEKMNTLVANMTPKDPLVEAEEQWNERAQDYADAHFDVVDRLSNKVIRETGLLRDIALSVGRSEQELRSMLHRRGYDYQTNSERGYWIRPHFQRKMPPTLSSRWLTKPFPLEQEFEKEQKEWIEFENRWAPNGRLIQ